MNNQRSARLSAEIQKAVFSIITERLKNPLVTEMFSIVKADVSRDMSHAKIYVSVFSVSAGKRKATFDAIKNSAKQIRFYLAKEISTRVVPELEFVWDDSMEYSARMDGIFNSLNKGGKND